MRFALLAALTLLLLPQTGHTQEALPPPRLLVPTEQGKERPLSLARADIRVQIAGPLAQTTLTLTFKNDTTRVLQGNLDFPLPEGATISGYGLDVNGKMVDGVPVEKEKARVTFEQEVRKGADPGLVEATVGNNFRTRVYPIPANGTRTIKVQYVTDLLTSGRDLIYRVPLRWNQRIPFATLAIEADQTGTFPKSSFGTRTKLLTFVQQGNRYTAERTFEEVTFDTDLEIRLPDASTRTLTLVEPFTRTTLNEAETYFVASDVPPLPLHVSAPKADVRRIGIVWDASLSRRDANLNREQQILRDLFRRLGSVTVDVTVLRDIAEPTRTFSIANGDAPDLITYLREMVYDGGTQLGVAPFPTNAANGTRYDFHLLFTDGLGNLGKSLPFPSVVPVYTVNSQPVANHALLRHIAERSGGVYLNLARMSDLQAVGKIGPQPFSLLSVTVESGRVSDVLPNGIHPVEGRSLVSGRLLSNEATLRLSYGTPGDITYTDTITLRRSEGAGSGQAGRFWAQQKAEVLALLPDLNREWLLSLGKDFNIVTNDTSLMVLERVEQYVEHDITPPKSAPELYAAYEKQRHKQVMQKRWSETDKLTDVLGYWQERVHWWEGKYPKKSPSPGGEAQPRMARLDAAIDAPIPANGVAPSTSLPQLRATPASHALQGGAGGGGFPGGRVPGAAVPARTTLTRRQEVFAFAPAKAKAPEFDEATGASITIKPWSPDTPYLKAMKADAPHAYDVYLRNRPQYVTSPSFYLDCAEYFLQQRQTVLGLRILTNILELQLESAPLTRIVAHRLAQLARRDLAVALFEQVTKMRPEEPQSWRDLALVLADRADALAPTAPKQALADYNRALQLLNKVVLGRWDRFQEIESIVLEEGNAIIVRARRLPPVPGQSLVIPFDKRLVRNLDCDLRIVMTWDADSTDMDLWVDEPTGERCIYNHNRTTIGGRLSRDFTDGYGPEEYCLRKAPKGAYKIRTNYFGEHQQRLTGATTVQVTVYTNFGRPSEKRQTLTLRLTTQKETVDIGTAKID